MIAGDQPRRGRVMLVSDARSIHAQRALDWARRLGYETVFANTSGAVNAPSAAGDWTVFPRPRGARILKLALGERLAQHWVTKIQSCLLASLFKRWKPDIVHCHWIDGASSAIARTGIRNLVLTAWGSDINRFFDSDQPTSHRQEVSEALNKCRFLTGDSDDIRHKAERLAGRSLQWRLLPLGIDIKPYQTAASTGRGIWRERLRIPRECFVFGSFRAWSPNYRHALILEAFAEACKGQRAPLGLLLKIYHPLGVAEHGEEEQNLKRRVEELGLQDRIWWVHDVEHGALPGLYAAVDALVNCPQRDALPVTFFEAAAARCPVITNNLPAYDIPLVKEGFVVLNDDAPETVASAMVELADAVPRGHWESRLTFAANQVKEHFSEAAAMSVLREIYQTCLSTKA